MFPLRDSFSAHAQVAARCGRTTRPPSYLLACQHPRPFSFHLHMHRPLQTKPTGATVTKFGSTACVHSVPFGIWVATESDTRTDGGRL